MMQPIAWFITFSTFHKKKLFKDRHLYGLFVESLKRAVERHNFVILAYVVMPNHIHLLLQEEGESTIPQVLRAIKQPFSSRALNYLKEVYPRPCQLLHVKHGNRVFTRFWQAGGWDIRSINNKEALPEVIRYIHDNPARTGLVRKPEDWEWSSASGFDQSILP